MIPLLKLLLDTEAATEAATAEGFLELLRKPLQKLTIELIWLNATIVESAAEFKAFDKSVAPRVAGVYVAFGLFAPVDGMLLALRLTKLT